MSTETFKQVFGVFPTGLTAIAVRDAAGCIDRAVLAATGPHEPLLSSRGAYRRFAS